MTSETSMSPFDLEGLEWKRVSPRLIGANRISQLFLYVPTLLALLASLLIAALTGAYWVTALAVPLLVVSILVFALTPRRVRSIGYAETDDDLYIRRGIMFRSLVVVPYGRMQYVDVNAGPLLRAKGLATVELHTATAETSAVIPGLPVAEAARLREVLSRRGEARLAGL